MPFAGGYPVFIYNPELFRTYYGIVAAVSIKERMHSAGYKARMSAV